MPEERCSARALASLSRERSPSRSRISPSRSLGTAAVVMPGEPPLSQRSSTLLLSDGQKRRESSHQGPTEPWYPLKIGHCGEWPRLPAICQNRSGPHRPDPGQRDQVLLRRGVEIHRCTGCPGRRNRVSPGDAEPCTTLRECVTHPLPTESYPAGKGAQKGRTDPGNQIGRASC